MARRKVAGSHLLHLGSLDLRLSLHPLPLLGHRLSCLLDVALLLLGLLQPLLHQRALVGRRLLRPRDLLLLCPADQPHVLPVHLALQHQPLLRLDLLVRLGRRDVDEGLPPGLLDLFHLVEDLRPHHLLLLLFLHQKLPLHL